MSEPARPQYFDANATTPVDPRVLTEMLPYLTEHFGNPESAQHVYGWKAKAAVDQARMRVAKLIGSLPSEIIFTSGATESIQLAVLGYLEGQPAKRHLITSQVEHKATLEICARAEKFGHEVTFLKPDQFGRVSVDQVREALQPNTAIVTLMHANNEIGTFNPIAEIGALLRERGIVFHVDAAQTVGKHPIDVKAMNIDLLSISAHKFYGPKGSGALYMRRPAIHVTPLMVGGGQERGLRSGTHNVPGIVGLGRAAEIAMEKMDEECARLTALRDRMIRVLLDLPGVELNGHPTERLCNNVHVRFNGIGGDDLLTGLEGFAFSTGSACAGGAGSHVMAAIGHTGSDPLTSIARFGLSRFTGDEQVDALIEKVTATVEKYIAKSAT